MRKLKVLVSGAGMGGLCLAQALRHASHASHASIDVEVFEREAHPGQRSQGYRLHIESDGADALRSALPPALYALFEATAMRPRPFTAMLDPHLVEKHRIDVDEQERGRAVETPLVHLNVNRATLRQILLLGLEDVVRFAAAGAQIMGQTPLADDSTGA
ncbi:monooxygenase, FAD-binding protein [Minicystis rosea]|nr:monooxygenase, FAD-binding protein [Minicystis rosea]